MKNRDNEILSFLTCEKRIEVAELARRLGVSSVTVRKDLDALEKRGVIAREHGFAVLRSADDINGRMAYHYEEKRRIAAKAAELVADGETVIIESGSCCALLAEALVKRRRDIGIITNSAFIAGMVRALDGAKIMLLGGIYQNDSQVTVGPMLAQCAGLYCADKLFVGTDGFTEISGFANSDPMRAQAVRDMAARAESAFILTESEKFLRRGVAPLNIDGRVKAVITDSGIPIFARRALSEKGIAVIEAV